MAATGSAQSRRFAAACGVLSRCIKSAEARPVATVVLPLMPGAEMPAQDAHAAGPAPVNAQITIFYAGKVLVLDEVPADRAAELLRVAAASGTARGSCEAADGDLPMARKASLQRFMEKRKGRLAARAVPYSRPECDAFSCSRLTLTL
ncbi:protein TIFY 11e-like [Hordeum vulgare subsp. vulgare]|uniref:Protein TIFY n=1 Tax=Hordeum vulgare subsp. vulgare TaxID=112509 RepID=A0A8I6Y6Y7_HORVV|nr:protein TIFY 11e-like [Hordeum vulgare subsp. vulgare]